MKERTKNTIAIVGLVVALTSLLVYDAIVIAEFYTSKYGKQVDATVIDVSELCRNKNKYVTLIIEGETERLRLYGPLCKVDDFPLNGHVMVRVNETFDLIVLPNNSPIPRLLIFPFLTIIMFFALKEVIKYHKKFNI